MGNEATALIDEAIKLELMVSDVYTLFRELFPEDAEFWWKLALEEKNHAALIRSWKEFFQPAYNFPPHLLCSSLEEMSAANSKLLALMKQFKSAAPSRGEAFTIAFELERSASELHFQQFMEREANSKLDEIFKQLNRDDKDHAQRISTYMETHGFSVKGAGLDPGG